MTLKSPFSVIFKKPNTVHTPHELHIATAQHSIYVKCHLVLTRGVFIYEPTCISRAGVVREEWGTLLSGGVSEGGVSVLSGVASRLESGFMFSLLSSAISIAPSLSAVLSLSVTYRIWRCSESNNHAIIFPTALTAMQQIAQLHPLLCNILYYCTHKHAIICSDALKTLNT